MDQYADLSLIELAQLFATGDLQAESYADHVNGRAASLEELHAFSAYDATGLLEAARDADIRRARGQRLPPLHGVPIAVKDNIDVLGFPTTAGTPALANYRPRKNAPVVQLLLDNGALVPGKANMHELAMGASSDNARFGTVRNPYAIGSIPGGSSGGSAVAVAARIVPGAIGSDTIGSIRIPAALCGCVGFRPSSGRYSQAGIVPLSRTRDTAGPLVRSVADAALLDSIMSPPRTIAAAIEDQQLKGLRLGVPRKHFYSNLDREIALAIEETLRLLADRGVVLVAADIPHLESFNPYASFTGMFYEVRAGVRQYLEESGCDVTLDSLVSQIASPDVKALAQQWHRDNVVPEEAFRHDLAVNRPAMQGAFAEYFKLHALDATIFPTTVEPARAANPDGSLTAANGSAFSSVLYLQNTDPGSYCGIPGISLPMGVTAGGLPIGLALDAPYGCDARLLGIAAAIEAVLPRIPAPKLG